MLLQMQIEFTMLTGIGKQKHNPWAIEDSLHYYQCQSTWKKSVFWRPPHLHHFDIWHPVILSVMINNTTHWQHTTFYIKLCWLCIVLLNTISIIWGIIRVPEYIPPYMHVYINKHTHILTHLPQSANRQPQVLVTSWHIVGTANENKISLRKLLYERKDCMCMLSHSK